MYQINLSLFQDKENRNNKGDGKRVMDARKAQDGPRPNRNENFGDNDRKVKRNDFEDGGNRPRGGGGGNGRGGRGGPVRGGRGGRRGGGYQPHTSMLRTGLMAKNTMNSARRLQRDYKELTEAKEPLVGVSARPLENDMFTWHGNLRGPPETKWANAVFHF